MSICGIYKDKFIDLTGNRGFPVLWRLLGRQAGTLMHNGQEILPPTRMPKFEFWNMVQRSFPGRAIP